MFRNKLFHFLILFGVCIFLFFYRLNSLHLLDPDEPRYAEVAREMLEKKEFLIPHFNYEPRLKKPPLFYWLIVLSYKLFGVNEFSARFPSAISALGGVFLTFLIGKNLYNFSTGFLAGLILATSLEYLILSRLAITDMVLCFFFLSSIFLFLKYKENKKIVFLFFFWIALSLGFLTKGPVGLLPILIILFYLFFEKEISLLKEIFWKRIYFILLFILLGLSWYLYLIFKFGYPEMLSFFRYETIERFAYGFIHRAPFFYFIPIIILGFLPWIVFLPWQKVNFLRDRFLIIWFLTIFLFFSLSHSKIPTYILSLFPCLSIFLANFFTKIFNKEIPYPTKKFSFSLSLFYLLLVLFILGMKLFLKDKYLLDIKVFHLFLFSIAIFLISLFINYHKKLLFFFSIISLLPFIFLILFYQFFAFDLSSHRSTKHLLLPIKEEIKNRDVLIAYNFKKPSLVFYAQHKIVFLQDLSELLNYLDNTKQSLWIFIKSDDFTSLKDKYNFLLKNKIRNLLVGKIVLTPEN